MSISSLTALHHALPPGTSAIRIVPRNADAAQMNAWHARYQRLFIGHSIVRGVLALRTQHDNPHARMAFGRLRHVWSGQGGYIETVSLDQVRSWPRSEQVLIAEVSPLCPDGCFGAVADCVFRLPGRGWVMQALAEEPAEIYDRALYDRIVRDGPSATALIDFLGVLPEWANRELAGYARFAGMQEIQRRNAALPPERRIRHVVGMTFAVKAVEPIDPSERKRFGPVISLADLGEEPIVNRASTRAISLSQRCPARSLGCWTHITPVPVSMNGRSYRIHADWTVRVRSLDDITATSPPYQPL